MGNPKGGMMAVTVRDAVILGIGEMNVVGIVRGTETEDEV